MSLSIYAGTDMRSRDAQLAEALGKTEKNGKENGKNGSTIYAGDTGLIKQDSVIAKKIQAQKEAMKALMDEHSGETELDSSVEDMKAIRDDLAAEAKGAEDEIRKVQDMRKEYQESYGVAEGMPEPEDETYQKAMKDFDDMEETWRGRADSAKRQRMGIGISLDELAVDRAKKHGMVDARAEADKIIESAGNEIIGMLQDEAIEHVDEKLEETVEEAEKKAEEKEEKEEELEEVKAEQEKQEQRIEEAGSKYPGSEPISSSRPPESGDLSYEIEKSVNAAENLQKQVKNILKEEILLPEDMKGIVVDTKL